MDEKAVYFLIFIAITMSILFGYRIFIWLLPKQINLEQVIKVVDKAAYAVYLHLIVIYLDKYRDKNPDFSDSLAFAVCNVLFAKKPDNDADNNFLKSNDILIQQELEAIHHDKEVSQIVTLAVHLVNMVKYLPSKSNNPNEKFESFKYSFPPLSQLEKLKINTSLYTPRNRSIPVLYKNYEKIVNNFYRENKKVEKKTQKKVGKQIVR